ncbi:hypothetical protein [Paraburkholderia solisilvae]|uniref:hypothetical protein n=1 Tax=Paraburkholderia solisilvae TaxID=624376 RepID=UPI001582414B
MDTNEPVLDTVDRVSELCFGLFMAVSDGNLEPIRLRLASRTDLPDRQRFVQGDFLGALGIFIVIVFGVLLTVAIITLGS